MIEVGSIVKFKREFLKSTGMQYTSFAGMEARVEKLTPFSGRGDVATLLFQDDTEMKSLTCNLVLKSRIHLEAV